MAFTFEQANNPNRKRNARNRVLTKLAKQGPSIAGHFTGPERSQLREMEHEGLITCHPTSYRWSLTSAGHTAYQATLPIITSEAIK